MVIVEYYWTGKLENVQFFFVVNRDEKKGVVAAKVLYFHSIVKICLNSQEKGDGCET